MFAASGTVGFETFRSGLNAALAYCHGSKGGRPPFDAVPMSKIPVIQGPAISPTRTRSFSSTTVANGERTFLPHFPNTLAVWHRFD